MIAYLIGAWCPWIGLIIWMWIAEYQRNAWLASPWSLPRLEYFDVPWIVVLLLVVPIIAMWTCAELIRILRRPRFFDRRAGVRWWRRAALGLILGTLGVAILGVAAAYQDWTHAPDVVNVIASATLPTLVFGWFLPRIRPGHCIVCNYDTRHLPFPDQPGPRRCPECGSPVA